MANGLWIYRNFGINKAMHTVLVLSLLKSTALAILYTDAPGET